MRLVDCIEECGSGKVHPVPPHAAVLALEKHRLYESLNMRVAARQLHQEVVHRHIRLLDDSHVSDIAARNALAVN